MEVFTSLVVLLLLIADVSETPPCRIMSHIIIKSLLKSPLSFGKILVVNMLMAAQRMGVGILRVELNSPCKELQSLLMLFLQ